MKNDIVHKINNFILDMLPRQKVEHLSCDMICKASSHRHDKHLLYPTKLLNSLKFSGLPNHSL